MRVHPLAVAASAAASRRRHLRRLPHVFQKVLELPLPSDATVAVTEDSLALYFASASAAAAGGPGGGVRAEAVEIYPGIMKVVVLDEFWGDGGGMGMELDRWRFRLPACTRPALATAEYVGGELVVTVPKGAGEEEGGGGGDVGGGIGVLVAVQ